MRLDALDLPRRTDWNANQRTKSSKGAVVEKGQVNRHTSMVLFNIIASWVDGMGGTVRGIPRPLQTSHPREHSMDHTGNYQKVALR